MAFNIWRITDGKAGHDSQSIGLCDAIDRLKPANRFDIDAFSTFSVYKNLLLKKFNTDIKLPNPDLIIGAGHGCHLSLICAKRARNGKTIVLMKPSLPLSFFDVCIVPKHDINHDQNNIITTDGALNPIKLNENKTNNTRLILLGGPSKHYYWDSESILNQISQIIDNDSGVNWVIADSPRTPKVMMDKITHLANKDIDILSFTNTNSKTIREFIFKAENIWVSTDSVSMIYEALSSGAAVGLLDLKLKKKISDALNPLINNQQLTSFKSWKENQKLIKPNNKFNEANRCASILLKRGFLD